MNNQRINNEVRRRLKTSQEYKLANFAWGFTLGIAVILLFNGADVIDKELNIPLLILTGIYTVFGLLQWLVSVRIRRDLIRHEEIRKSTRVFGFILIIALATGNVFIAIAALDIIKKHKSMEYTLSIYMILVDLWIIILSGLNLFKPYVANTFLMGMGALLVLSVIHIIAMLLVARMIHDKRVDRRLMPLAYVLIVTAVTGNLFAFLLGITILSKIKHHDKQSLATWIDILRRLFRNTMAVLGLLFIVLLLSVSICSYFTFEASLAIENNFETLLQSPSLVYPFGTDDYGRCVFTRIILGARISLIVGIISTLIPVIIGGYLGALSGFYGKTADNVIMRTLDILYAVPGMLLAIAIVAAFGANTTNLILALSVGAIPTYARTMRATVMSVSNFEFVEAAKACGAKDNTIIFKHIIPNSLAPIIVKATLTIGTAVIATSSLSYLGLGVEPHIPEWGNILKVGSKYLETNPYLAIYPGLAIIAMVLAFNFFGDGLRDALDPKLK
ncbi:ABC transporter permease [Paenibacillus marinisediminis]